MRCGYGAVAVARGEDEARVQAQTQTQAEADSMAWHVSAGAVPRSGPWTTLTSHRIEALNLASTSTSTQRGCLSTSHAAAR